jgi:GntR family transcriptional regulator/MocR family aminotransferase
MLRPWNIPLLIDALDSVPVYLQIVQAIIEEIRRGRLTSGTPMPGSRILAEQLAVNRKTVIQAYQELLAQGWLEVEPKRGTFVSHKIPVTVAAPFLAGPPAKAAIPDQPGFGFTPRESLPAEPLAPGNLVFTDGTPDVRLAPIGALASAYRQVLQAKGRRNMLGYGDAAGSFELREALSVMLNQERSLACRPENLCITRGSQMGLFLLAEALIKPGDVVVVDALSYPPAWEAFRRVGATLVPVPVDTEGMQVEELERICRQQPPRAVLLTPHHQFPTTVTLKADRRLHLLDLATRYRFAIIEDDYDHEFHYGYRPVLPLASADTEGLVLYTGSFSKLVAPSIRMGYVAGPRQVIETISQVRAIVDRQGDLMMEVALAELIEAGEIKRHARRAHGEYHQRRDALAAFLGRYLGDAVRFSVPEGGLALWVEFDAAIDVDQLAKKAVRQHVVFTPGSRFALRPEDRVNAVRLGFASLSVPELEEAVKRIARALDA